MDSHDKLNVAVVGLGWVAINRHIPVILRHPHLNLYGVVDKRPERIQRVTEKYPWLKSSLSHAGEMPWGNEVQAVVIATDPLNHYSLAKKMILAGKHVLMEKPLTMTVGESRELQELSTQTGLSCCVVHNFQFSRSALKLNALIQTGRLGEIQGIEAMQLSNPRRRLPTWYEQLPFGLFYDESPHLLYMLEFLADREIQHVTSAVIKKTGQNTPLSVTGYYTAGQIPVRLSMNFNASLSEWHIAVLGTKGMGVVDLFRDILTFMPNDGLHRAREIILTSGSFIATHLLGFLQSGVLLTRRKLFYGADVVWDKFVAGLLHEQPAVQISTARGSRVVELQHELMGKSAIFELPADENPDPQ